MSASMIGWTVATAYTKVYRIRLDEQMSESEEAAVMVCRHNALKRIEAMRRYEGATIGDDDFEVEVDKVACDGGDDCPCAACAACAAKRAGAAKHGR